MKKPKEGEMNEPHIARDKDKEELWTLEACPFCGASPVIVGAKFDEIRKWNISCDREPPLCWIGPQTGWMYILEDAVRAWNKREDVAEG